MALIVQKFGGSSVADADKIRNVARIVTETYRRGHSVVVVLSAQGDTTDDLIEKAREIARLSGVKVNFFRCDIIARRGMKAFDRDCLRDYNHFIR